LSEAENCTFEPKINFKKEKDSKEDNKEEEIINKRVSNKEWVDSMGKNFTSKFPLRYKEGICKKAYVLFLDGKFTEVIRELEKAFDIEAIKCKFDPKYAEYMKKKKANEKKSEQEKQEEQFEMYRPEKKVGTIEKDNFSNPKNHEICLQVYEILKGIDDYNKSRLKDSKRLKEELKIIEQTKNDKPFLENTTIKEENVKEDGLNHSIKYTKDKYFKFFKTMMCPLK
jgi:hypothetical protein